MAKGPEHIEKYKKLTKHTDQIADTTARHHRQAYDKAVEDLLILEGEKDADYDLLKKTKHQVAFADKMSDFYIKKAKDYFGVQKDLSDLEKELLMKAYSGTTKSELKRMIAKHKDKFSFDQFKQYHDEFVDQIRGTLRDSAAGHFTKDHLDDILKYCVTEDALKEIKPYMSLDNAKQLLRQFIVEESSTGYKTEKYDLKKFLHLNDQIKQISKGRGELLNVAVTDKLAKKLEDEDLVLE